VVLGMILLYRLAIFVFDIYFISFMYIDQNDFNGTIPPEMFKLKHLKEITLGKIAELHI